MKVDFGKLTGTFFERYFSILRCHSGRLSADLSPYKYHDSVQVQRQGVLSLADKTIQPDRTNISKTSTETRRFGGNRTLHVFS